MEGRWGTHQPLVYQEILADLFSDLERSPAGVHEPAHARRAGRDPAHLEARRAAPSDLRLP